MKLYLYSMKNRLSGIFEKPFAEIYDPTEYPELLVQSLALAPVDALQRHGEYDVYCVGSFDSQTGAILSGNCDFVMSLEQICNSYVSQKENKANVRSEEQA